MRSRLFLGGSLISISIIAEFLQLRMLNRSFEFPDILANLCGVTLAFVIIDWKKIRREYRYTGLIAILGVVAFLSLMGYHSGKYYQQGLNYQRAGRYDLAKAEYLRAIDKGIDSPVIFNELAWIMTEYLQDDPVTAVKYASMALAKRPDNPDYLDTYGWSLYYLEKPADALKHLQKAYALNPNIFCINYHLGATYLQLGQTEKARYHLMKQIARNSQDREGLKSAEILKLIPPK